MTIRYYRHNGTLAVGGCTDGADGVDNTNIDTPRRLLSEFATQFAAAAAGDQFLFAQGAAWDSATTGQIKNTNSTLANPVIIGSYDATGHGVTGGAGIKPIFTNTTGAILNFNKGTLVHTEGHTIDGLDIRGTASWGILGGGDMDGIIVQNCAFSGVADGCQVNSATTASVGLDGITTGWTVRNCTFSNHPGIGCLMGCTRLLIEICTFDHCGTQVTDHGIYEGGVLTQHPAVAIASITGDGTTATLTTTVDHNIDPTWHITIGVAGSVSSGSGTFNCLAAVPDFTNATVTGARTIQYLSTGTPSASTLGTYSITRDVEIEDVVIRNCTFSEGHVGAAGQNNNAHLVFHGHTSNILVENCIFSETVPSSAASSSGIEFSTGSYGNPEKYEGFNKVVIRNNTCIRLGVGIGVDICDTVLIENNYVYTNYTAGNSAQGILLRDKYFNANLAITTTPNKVIIRNNTVHLDTTGSGSFGIGVRYHSSDPSWGSGFQVYNNLVVLEAPSINTVSAFNTTNAVAGDFSLKDYNYVVYTGATVPKWENTFALGAQPTGGDTHSTFTSSTSLTADQPFFTASKSSPAVSASFAGVGAGHPTLWPRLGYGGVLRNQGVGDIGAYEVGATFVVANCQTTKPS